MMKLNLFVIIAGFVVGFVQGIEVDAVLCEEWEKDRQLPNKECEDGCFAVWYNTSGVLSIEHKSCWGENGGGFKDDCEGIRHIQENTTHNPIFCACRKNLCNAYLTWVGNKNVSSSGTNINRPTPKHKKENDHHLIFIILALCGILMVFVVLFMLYKKKRSNFKPEPEGVSKGSEVETLISSEELLPPIDLKDFLSQGQFCSVRKGRMGCKDVAVKIFPITQWSKPTPSALTEEDMYMVCKLSHNNILKFIGKHVHDDGNLQQLWLVTEYIEQGSLSDYLKRNPINRENLFTMAQGMALGMAYLHAEIPRVKPSIAHRDIKSKNILVKNNLTCCISDFGLSLKFDDRDGPGDTHGQVGTRRYMSPEVLEGAINFSREAFLRIDMYAFALCLWELLTRCTAVQEDPVCDYKLPFEEEVGIHPSLEELQDYVVNKKLRPHLPAEWRNTDQAIDGVIVTIEECWDHDADARLTADCVAERLKLLHGVGKQTSTPLAVSYKSLDMHENGLLV